MIVDFIKDVFFSIVPSMSDAKERFGDKLPTNLKDLLSDNRKA